MKAVFALALAATVLSMSSCRKDYTCTCTTLESTERHTFSNLKRVDAEDACQAKDLVVRLQGGQCTLN
jgi:hypothetical protein